MPSEYGSRWRVRFQHIYKADQKSHLHYIPNIGFEDGIAIYTIITNSPVNKEFRALELGGGVGYSTLWILYALEDLEDVDTYLTTVEIDMERAMTIKELLDEAGIIKTRYSVVNDDAIKYLETLNQKQDFIFIDIDKGSYISALEKLGKIVHRNTIVMFHNAFLPSPPKEFIDTAVNNGWEVKIIPTRVGLFLLKRG